ncbi:MAG TPA: SPFH domain-containing protein [Moraxellaceae bacterium]|nr:SPFH domain-containing protein [Moraxellaceae bacterium]
MAWNRPGQRPGQRPSPSSPPGGMPPGLDDVLARLAALTGSGLSLHRILLLFALVVALVYGSLGLHRVRVGEQCLVLRNGRVLAVQSPGFYWNPPVIDAWRRVNVERLRDATLSTDVISQDEDIVSVTLTLRYRVGDVRAYLLGFADAESEMLRTAESAVQQAAARLPAAGLSGASQHALVAQVQDAVSAHLNDIGGGLHLEGISVAGATTPAELEDAVADVSRARAETALQVQKARDEGQAALRQAREQGAREVAEAEHERARVLQQAQSDALHLAAAIDEALRDASAARRRIYDDAVMDVMRRTPTVIVGEGGLSRLGISADQLRAPTALPPSPDAGARP